MRPTAFTAMFDLMGLLAEVPPEGLRVPPILKERLPPDSGLDGGDSADVGDSDGGMGGGGRGI